MDVEEDFKRMWKIASTAQFVKVFQELFKLPEVEIENLEEGLLNKGMYGIHVLKNLIVALLRGICPNGGVRLENYETFLQKVVAKIWISQDENPLNENTNFEGLIPESKLDIVYLLCLNLLDKASDPRSKWKDQVSKMSSDLLRVQPLGCDDEGNEFWYFYGTRLYKQESGINRKIKDCEKEGESPKNTSSSSRSRGRPRKIKRIRSSDGESDESEEALPDRDPCTNLGEKSRWSVVCNTYDDWVALAEKFKESESKCERALLRTLTDNFLPVLNETYQAKEKKLQQKLRELIPKPTFTRMETRQRRRKSAPDTRGNDKEHSARVRERRLEERNNRRLSQNSVDGFRRRTRSGISSDESSDDFEDEPRWKNEYRILFQETDNEVTRKKSKIRESLEAQANEIYKYASLVSESSDNKSQMLKVFTLMKLDKNTYPFHYPIDKEEFPDYYDFISEPMDLSRIERKLRLNIYKTAAEIDSDFRKIVENCRLYFGADSERFEMGICTWRLFRRLMRELPARNSGSAGGLNETQFLEMKNTDARHENAGRKRKHFTSEALEEEAELAVERSHSMTEEHFQNLTRNVKNFTRFSDLKVESIHGHSSDLIKKLVSDSSNLGSEENNSSLDTSPKSMEINHYEDNTNSSLSMNNNGSENFNFLSSDSEVDPPSANEVDTHSVSHNLSADSCSRDRKASNGSSSAFDIRSSNNYVTNLVLESGDLNSSSSSNSFESYHSSNHDASPEDSANHSSKHAESNATFPNTCEYAGFTPEDEPDRSSTIEASCLGLTFASKCHPNTSTQPAIKKFAKIQGNSFSASDNVGKESVVVHSSNSTFNNQGISAQESAKSSSQHISTSMEHQIPKKAPPFDFTNIFSNTSNSLNTAQLTEPQLPNSSALHIPSQISVSHSTQNRSTKTNFPTMKVCLPPSTGELTVVPGDASSMTFHLLAKLLSDPSQTIQSSVKIHAKNLDCECH